VNSAAGSPPISVSLRALFPAAKWVNGEDLMVSAASNRAEFCLPGGLFAVFRGTRHDGREFMAQALARGVAGLLVDQPVADVALPQCVVPSVRQAYAIVCAQLAGQPSLSVKTIGVTGTNGKTTTTWMLRSILHAAGQRCGVLGTVEYHDGVAAEPAVLTTPDSHTLQHWLQRMKQNETGYAAIEISSHALDQDRAAGVSLAAAALTNVTHDHLDYHGSFAEYAFAKRKIWALLNPAGVAVVNLDDPGSVPLSAAIPKGVRRLTTSLLKAADITARDVQISLTGAEFLLQGPSGAMPCRLGTTGRHNVANALTAAAVAMGLGVSSAAIATGLANFHGVPGRMEPIDQGQNFAVFVDYAHTDDALSRVLKTLRSMTSGRLICVFGAGGDRDRAKRPKLGRAALEADVAIVTSDNPRTEDPRLIIQEILAGMPSARAEPIVEIDRHAAIRHALTMAGSGDCVLIAGKGHEQEQILGTTRTHFDDREVAREVLRERQLFASSHCQHA